MHWRNRYEEGDDHMNGGETHRPDVDACATDGLGRKVDDLVAGLWVGWVAVCCDYLRSCRDLRSRRDFVKGRFSRAIFLGVACLKGYLWRDKKVHALDPASVSERKLGWK